MPISQMRWRIDGGGGKVHTVVMALVVVDRHLHRYARTHVTCVCSAEDHDIGMHTDISVYISR